MTYDPLGERLGESSARATPPRQLRFEDNRLLPALYGEHEQHLATIERELGVSLVTRGNHLTIYGSGESVEIAASVLSSLYQRLKRGLDVDKEEIEAALRLAHQEDGQEPYLFGPETDHGIAVKTQRRLITPRSAMQARYMRALHDHELVLGIGPAGTGKTYLAVAVAVTMLMKGSVDRIILSRPAVEAGERLGFLPGDLKDKVDPYLRPLYDALRDMLPAEQVMKRIASGEIEVAPLAFMRGRTLSNSFVILDEAQNTTPMQMKMFLTRLGQNSRMAVTGDLSQIDLPSGQKSGLSDAISIIGNIPEIGIVEFGEADVVRHALVGKIVGAYDRHDKQRSQKSQSHRAENIGAVLSAQKD